MGRILDLQKNETVTKPAVESSGDTSMGRIRKTQGTVAQTVTPKVTEPVVVEAYKPTIKQDPENFFQKSLRAIEDTAGMVGGKVKNIWENLTTPTITVDGITAPTKDFSKSKAMEFPVTGSNVNPIELSDKSKTLNETASILHTMAKTVNKNDKKSVDTYNEQVAQFKTDVELFNKDLTDYNFSQNFLKNQIVEKHPTMLRTLGNNISELAKGVLIDTPADYLSNSEYIKNVGLGMDISEKEGKPDFGANFGTEMLKKLSLLTKSISGATAGYVDIAPVQQNELDFTDKIVSAFAQGVGMAAGLGKIEGAVSPLVSSLPGMSTLISKYPAIVGKYALPFMRTATAFTIFGQTSERLDNATVVERLKTAGIDFVTAIPYFALGLTPKAWISIPASGLLGYGAARLEGASQEDAIASGVAFMALDGFTRAMSPKGADYKRGLITQKDAQFTLKNEAFNTLNEFSTTKIDNNSSQAEIRKAYLEAAMKTHPDKTGGDDLNFKRVNAANDIINPKEKPDLKLEEEIKTKVAEDIKTQETKPFDMTKMAEEASIEVKQTIEQEKTAGTTKVSESDLSAQIDDIMAGKPYEPKVEKIETPEEKQTIPIETFIDAYKGTSFDPEKRGEQRKKEYEETISTYYEDLKKYVDTPEKTKILDQAFQEFVSGYKKRMLDILNSEARTISPMISGRGNFPVARNRKILDSLHKKYLDLSEYEEKSIKRIENDLNPNIFLGTSKETIEAIQKKKTEMELTRDKMKEANKIIRSGVDVEQKLIKLGFKKDQIETLQKPDFAGRKGFADFELTSINNKIKNLEKNITQKSEKREKADTVGEDKKEIGDNSIVKNYDEDRLQIFFKEKPSTEVIQKLKDKGFHWSPKNSAWQRVLTKNAEYQAEQILKDITPKEEKVDKKKEIEDSIKTSREEGKTELEIVKDLQKNEKLSFDEAVAMVDSVKKEEASFKLKPEGNITLKTLDRIGDRQTISKQFIADLARKTDIKKVEKDIIEEILASEGDVVDVEEFKNKVLAEVLPLRRLDIMDETYAGQLYGKMDKYRSIVLPDEIRGKVADYSEHVYESPIQTSAGRAHFSDMKNYFGHTRVEDMIDTTKDGSQMKGTDYHAGPRRVIEVQSDLYQKGNLERELDKNSTGGLNGNIEYLKKELVDPTNSLKLKKYYQKQIDSMLERQKELSKLQQYNDPTAHFRMAREEINRAAKDGKTKIQFPTGETAMKVEGLGETSQWIHQVGENQTTKTTPKDLQIGMEIQNVQPDFAGNLLPESTWVITDVLEDGKFKAMPKELLDLFAESKNLTISGKDLISYAEHHATEHFWVSQETFDISGSVDTKNPIYKFYENELGKYLKNKYDAKLVTDTQGVTWWEINLTKEMADQKIEAFRLKNFDTIIFDRTKSEIQKGLKDLFGQDVPLEIVTDARGLGNTQALGVTVNNTIKLLKENGSLSEVVANHEGWHWFKRNLSIFDRSRIDEIEMDYLKANKDKADELRKIYKGSDAMIAEELMADEFADYTKTGKTTWGKIKAFFEKLWKTLQFIFKNKKEVVDMFNNVKETLSTTRAKAFEQFEPAFKKNKFPVFNTGDKLMDARLALEAAEKRMDVEPVKARKIKVSGEEIELPDELSNKLISLEVMKETLENDPLQSLEKFEAKSGIFKGELPEVLGKSEEEIKASSLYKKYKSEDVLEFMKRGDYYIQEAGFNDSEEAREAYAKYKEQKDFYNKYKKQTQEEIRDFKESVKDEIALDLLSEQSEKTQESDMRLEERKKAFDEGVKRAKEEFRKKTEKKLNIEKALNTPIEKLNAWQKLKQSLNPLSFVDRKTKNIFLDWNKKILLSRTLANAESVDFGVPEKDGLDVIFKYEAGEDTQYNNAIKTKFDALHEESKTRGVDLGFRERYLPHVYMEKGEEISQKIDKYLKDRGMTEDEITSYLNGKKLPEEMVRRLKLNPFFSKERIFSDYKTAMEYGLTPKYTNPDQLVAYYREELERTVANKELIESLAESAKILPVESAPNNWIPINLPFSQKGYYAEPRTAKVINGLFENANDFGFFRTSIKTVRNMSGKMQEIKLSAGLPWSNINFFSIGQLVKELTGGNIKSLNSFFRANFNKQSTDWMVSKRPIIDKMTRGGIDLRKTVDSYENLHKNLVHSPSLMEKAESTFNKMFNEKTFNSFMPMMQIQLFEDIYNSALKDGAPEEIATELATEVTKKNFGLSKYGARGAEAEDVLGAFFFAPKFREGIINTLMNTGEAGYDFVKNLGGIKSPLDPVLQRNRRLLLGMIISYFLYNLLNRKLNDGQNMWENPSNKKFALQIPKDDGTLIYIEFMPSFLSFARNIIGGGISLATGDISTATQQFGSVFSMPIRTTSEILANKDYFGRPIYKETDTGPQKALKIAKYIGLSVNHPYITEVINQIEDKKPLYQSIIVGLELPLKFSTKAAVEKSAYYDALDKKAKENARLKEKVQPTYDKIQELKSSGKIEEAKSMYDALTEDEKIMYKKIKLNPYDIVKKKEEEIKTALEKLDSGEGNKASIEKEVARNVYGSDYTKNQLNTVTKNIAFAKVFGSDIIASGIDKASSNEEKVLLLKKARKEMGEDKFREFFNKGRKTVQYQSGGSGYLLISDNVKELYLKSK